MQVQKKNIFSGNPAFCYCIIAWNVYNMECESAGCRMTCKITNQGDLQGQEETKMLWIMTIAVVALGAMAAREQNHAEDEAATRVQLSREFIA